MDSSNENRSIWGKLVSDPTVMWPVGAFAVARLVLSILGAVLWQLKLVPRSVEEMPYAVYGIQPVVEGVRGALLGVWQRYDTFYYMTIASQGYITGQLTVFPPGYPLAVRIASVPLGGDLLLAAFVVANLCCLLLLVAFYRLIIEEMWGEDTGRRACLYLLFYPTAMFLLVPYSEALFMLLTIVTAREARRGRWELASLAGLAATFTRMQGIFLSGLVGWEMMRQTEFRPFRLGWRVLLALAPAVAVAAYFAWLQLAGFPAFTDLHAQYWGQYPGYPFEPVLATLQRLYYGIASPMEYLNLLLTLITLGLGILVVRRLPFSYSIYFWAALIFTLSRTVAEHPLADQSRYCLTLFPAFIVLAQETRRAWLHRVVLYCSAALWMFFAGVFVMGGFVG